LAHSGHERSFPGALHEPDLAVGVAIAVAPLQGTPDLHLPLTGGRLGARNLALRNSLGRTPFPDRAHGAAGRARHAYGCAEFHHGLIEIPRARVGEKSLRMLPGLRRG